jgi:cell division protein FtsQ
MGKIPSISGPIVESGESHAPCSGVTTERILQNGNFPYGTVSHGTGPREDDAPAGSRFRSTERMLSSEGRMRRGFGPGFGAGSSPQMPAADDEETPRPRKRFPDKRFQDPKRRWWRPASTAGRIFLLLGVLAVTVSGVAGWLAARNYLERDSRFRIAGAEGIQAAGLSQVSRADMLPVFGEDIGRNIFFVNLNERRKALEKIPWIERATVMRLLPDQIRVSVVERTPIAFVRQGQQIGLVDADGVLLSMPASRMTALHYSFPVVTGIDAGDPQPSRRARMAVYQRLMHDLDSNGQQFSDQISEIDLTDPEDARVLMPEQGRDILAHFGDDKFLEHYQRYKAHIAEWRQQYAQLASVDLRYDQQVVLQMASGASAAQGAPAGTSAASGATAGTGTTGSAGAAGTGSVTATAADSTSAAAGTPAATPQPKHDAKPAPRRDAKKHAEVKHAKAAKPVSQPKRRAAAAGDE